MMIYGSIFGAFAIFASGIYHYQFFWTENWFVGMAVGLVSGVVWHADRFSARVFGFIGVFLILAILFGFGGGLGHDARAFFSAMSMGVVGGLALSAVLRWRRFKPHLIMIAKVEKVNWLLRMLGEPEN